MSKIEDDQAMLIRVFAGCPNTVASTATCGIVVIDTDVHLVVCNAVQTSDEAVL